jgi:HlyD family secretion protein/macrolide-specific efflux system membrane fusion protein
MHKKRNILLILGLIILIVIVVILIPKNSTTTTNYLIEQVKKGDINLTVSASGSVNPETTYNVSPRLNAKVLEVNVKSNDVVTQGQQLAKLDDTDLQSAVKAAQYTFNSAVYARDKLKALPIVDDYSVKQAQQQINSASVQLETAKRNLNNAKIESPIAGTVLAVNIKVGEYASVASPTPAFLVGTTGTFYAFLNINEIDINSIKVDQTVDLTIDALGQTLKGKVVEVENYGLNVLGIIYYKAKVSIAEQTGLKANMTVNADIAIDAKTNVLTLPSSAVTLRNEKSYVKLAKYDDKNVLTPVEQEVTTGINNNALIEILSGVNEGDKVVIISSSKNTIGISFGGTP